MFLTEQEILNQPQALARTLDYMLGQKAAVQAFFAAHPLGRFVFMGCGSSYMLSKSGQRLFAACPNTAASAVAGGDYLVNPGFYTQTFKDAILVTLSRSGQTSEMVRAVAHAKQTLGCPVISISMKDENDIMPMSDLDLTLDWCYDQSVCQTRTVTNLYAALALLAAFYSSDSDLEQAVAAAVAGNGAHIAQNRPALEEIAGRDWDNAVVLADGAVTGIAEEGALAFTEIAMLHGRCFNVLDYRHGPIVLNNEKTLTIMLVQPGERELQEAMIADLKTHNGTLVTVGQGSGNPHKAAAHVEIKDISRFEAWGIPFISVMQLISYAKAMELGNNPDQPKGLDAFIVLH